MSERGEAFLDAVRVAVATIADLPPEQRIEALNAATAVLAAAHPIQDPVSAVHWVPADQVVANDYNPNTVAPPEMELLRVSIAADGYTQPIVCYHDTDADRYVVVDGFHRNRVGKEDAEIRERVLGHLPVVVIDKPLPERIASTIRHNRARGTHGIQPMAQIVEELYFRGWSDKRIGEELGMTKDEVLRLKQFRGLAALFADRPFSKSWEWEEGEDGGEPELADAGAGQAGGTVG